MRTHTGQVAEENFFKIFGFQNMRWSFSKKIFLKFFVFEILDLWCILFIFAKKIYIMTLLSLFFIALIFFNAGLYLSAAIKGKGDERKRGIFFTILWTTIGIGYILAKYQMVNGGF